jgi:hypothetical protein
MVTIDRDKITELNASGGSFLIQGREFTIETTGDYEFSLTICEDAIKRQKTIIEFFAEAKKKAFDLHRMITRMESDLLKPYQIIESLIKERRLMWRKDQEALRQRAEDAARRIAKDEADKKALADAAALESEGRPEEAQEVLQQAIEAPAPAVVVQSNVPKQTGSAVRKKFSFRIDDFDKVPREFCSPDPRKIKAHVDAYGMNARIDGVTPFPDETEAIRTKGR